MSFFGGTHEYNKILEKKLNNLLTRMLDKFVINDKKSMKEMKQKDLMEDFSERESCYFRVSKVSEPLIVAKQIMAAGICKLVKFRR